MGSKDVGKPTIDDAEVIEEKVTPESTQDEIDYKLYFKQMNDLVLQESKDTAKLEYTKKMIEQTRGILLFLEAKLKNQ